MAKAAHDVSPCLSPPAPLLTLIVDVFARSGGSSLSPDMIDLVARDAALLAVVQRWAFSMIAPDAMENALPEKG
ncbi:MAG: hypothetical protein H0U76_27190 [Ktedonobacteraceae bacterium]|nr:hypothetical protein [Ktedonobacteraceae bacterium]